MYETLILIDPASDISTDDVEAMLSDLVSRWPTSPTLTRAEDALRIEWPDFHLAIHRSDLPHVVKESAEIAREFAEGRPQRDAISRCAARFEMAGTDDWDMAYFTDYCLVVEGLERLGTVYTFDQSAAGFTNL